MRLLLCSNVRLIYVPPLRAKPRDRPRPLLRWRTTPPRATSVHQILNRHLAHASRCSHSRSGQNAGRPALNAHLSTKTSACEESGDRSTSHGMPCSAARRVGEGVACCMDHGLRSLPGT